MKIHYGYEVIPLPGSILSHLSEMDSLTLGVYLWLCSDPSLWEKPKQVAKLMESDEKSVSECFSRLESLGMVETEAGERESAVKKTEEDAKVHAEKKPQKSKPDPAESPKLRRADVLPNYSSAEISDLLEARANMRALVDEAQRELGKMFSPNEVNILVGMTDYLEMDEESILLLLSYCKKSGKTNLRAIEKLAFELSDEGIKTTVAMEEELRAREARHTMEGEIRSMFGVKSRELTSKEMKFLQAWVSFGYDAEIIRLAYEITADATGSASFPYANTILEKWHAANLKTLEEIKAFLDSEKAEKTKKAGGEKKKPADRPAMTSFDTEDFFQAALKRSFEFEKKN